MFILFRSTLEREEKKLLEDNKTDDAKRKYHP